MSNFLSIFSLLCDRADGVSAGLAYRFLSPTGASAELTNEQLTESVRRYAHAIDAETHHGDRIGLVLDPGLDYVCVLLACLVTGRIPVPAYPPKNNRHGDRIRGVINDAGCSVLLASPNYVPTLARTLNTAQSHSCRVMAAQALDLPGWPRIDSNASVDAPALLQYTSGTTAEPRGVLITHGNLFTNLSMMQAALGTSQGSEGLSWLPPYHDMGLIGGILLPLFSGFPVTLLSPTHFLQEPQVWLKAISRYRATISPSPNFGYQHCTEKIPLEALQGVDLSSWTHALTGAEIIRPSTIETFTKKFGPLGFDKRAFYPCYGLAEATLFVTGKSCRDSHLKLATVPDPDSAQQRQAVGCGTPGQGIEIVIAAGDPLRPVPADQEGEILVRAPSVASGYWGHSAASSTFVTHIDDRGPYLRTGDAGFIRDGELFVTGRIKEMLIIRGRNFFPTDIEQVVERADGSITRNGVAAFALETADEDLLCIVAEVERTADADYHAIEQAIKREVGQALEIAVHDVCLIRKGTLPRTSSGKAQRLRCRTLYQQGSLICLTRSVTSAPQHALGLPQTAQETQMVESWEAVFRRPVSLDDDFFSLGGDSLRCVELVCAAREQGLVIDHEDIYACPTPRRLLARAVSLTQSSIPAFSTERLGNFEEGVPLAPQQRRYWNDYLLDIPGPSWSNVFREIDLPAPVPPELLSAALTRIAAGHPALRLGFERHDDGIRQRLHRPAKINVDHHDLRDLSAAAAQSVRQKLATELARHQFDLRHPPLLKVVSLQLGPAQQRVLFTFHHLVCDARSLITLQKELHDELAGSAGATTDGAITYLHYMTWLAQEYAGSDKRREDGEFWRRTLDGVGHKRYIATRPTLWPDYRGRCIQLRLPDPLLEGIRALASMQNVSAFSLVLTALAIHLARESGDGDVVIGSPAEGRDAPELRSLLGLFINLVMLRIHINSDDTMADVYRRSQSVILAALSHQLYQLDDVVRDLGLPPAGDRFPITTTFFSAIRFTDPCPSLGPQGRSVFDLQTDVRFEFMGYLLEFADGAILDLKFRRAMFSDEQVEAMGDSIVALLRVFIEDSSTLALS